jgi:hypothetical protein
MHLPCALPKTFRSAIVRVGVVQAGRFDGSCLQQLEQLLT